GRHRAGAALGTDRSGDLVQRADAGGGARVDLAARGGSAMTTVSMSVQDALWLTMDRPNNLMVVDGSMVLRRVPEIDDVTAVLQGAVERFPVLGRRAVRSGMGWAWEDDPDFDLARHIHEVELEPGTQIEELQRFM